MTNYLNKAVVLGISGNGLGIARSLGRRGIKVIVVSDTTASANLSCRYISEQWFFAGTESELMNFLLAKGSSFQEKPVLFPIRDATVLALADRMADIAEQYHLVMPEAKMVKKALCKNTFSKMAAELGLPVPRSFSIKSRAEIGQLPDIVRFPVIIKPEYRNDAYIAHVSGKAFIARDWDELQEQYATFSPYQTEAIVQEYIEGGDTDLYFCFQYYTRERKQAASLCGRKIRQHPPLCGSTSSCEVVINPAVEVITTEFFSRIHYVGPCSMELKRDPRDGAFYLIEPTIGRLDWNNAFTEGNGIPIPYINYLDALSLPIPVFRKKRIHRKWIRWSSDLESARMMRKAGTLTLGAWLRSLRPPLTAAIFAFDDPSPSLVAFTRRIRRKFFGGKGGK